MTVHDFGHGVSNPTKAWKFPIPILLPHPIRFTFCAFDDFQTITPLRGSERSQESNLYLFVHPLPSGLQVDYIQICVPHELDAANLALH